MKEKKKPLKPLLTVLMPVYNAEKFLAESIGSILNQTYYNFELLILDDASTDNSLKIIKTYAKEDKRIKILVNKTNQKQAKCRNRLLKTSKTEFIAWMDADDISLPRWLQTQIDFLKQNPNIDVVNCQLQVFGDCEYILKVSLLDSQIKSTFLLDCTFGTGGSMVKMKKIRANKFFFNEQLESAEDYDYWIKGCPFLSFAAIDEVLYRYRHHNAQESEANKEKQRKIHLLTVQKHLLQFNIKANLEIIKIILHWNDEKFDSHTSQKYQEAIRIFNKIFAIKNFYGYPGVEKQVLLFYYLNILRYLCKNRLLKKNREIFKEFFESISRQCSVTYSTKILRRIYCHYRGGGLKGKLFFIKDFGRKNYFTVKNYFKVKN